MQPTKYVYSAKGRDGKTLIFNGNEKLSDVVSILGENQNYRFESFLSGTQIETSPQVSLSTVGYISTIIAFIVAALFFFNQAKSSDKNNDSDVTKKNGVESTVYKR